MSSSDSGETTPGLNGCKLAEVLEESGRRRNKEWLAKKEAGNEQFRAKAYAEAIALYEDGFFIASGRQTMIPFLNLLFNRTKSTTPTFRIAQISPLIEVIAAFIEFDFKPALPRRDIPEAHRKILECVFPNLGAGQCASNIAQSLLNLHAKSPEAAGADALLHRSLWWAQVASKVLPEFAKSHEREVEALARLTRSPLTSAAAKQDLRRRLDERREELEQRRALVAHFQQGATYLQPEVFAVFMLRGMSINTFGRIYGKGTMREALRVVQACSKRQAALDGQAGRASSIPVSLQLSLVPVRGQYLSFGLSLIDGGGDGRCVKREMPNVQIQMCDPHPTSAEKLERPPHGHATEQAMKMVWEHLGAFLEMVDKLSGVSLSSVMLGQGLVGKRELFTSFLRDRGIEGAFVYDSLSTCASESRGFGL